MPLKIVSSPEKGSILTVVIILTGIMALAAASMINMVKRERLMEQMRIDRIKALQIADAGIEHTFWLTNTDKDWFLTAANPADTEDDGWGENDDGPEVISPYGLFNENERYEVDVEIRWTTDGRPRLFFISTGYIDRGTQMTTRKTIKAYVKLDSWGDYARFVENGSLSYGAGAVLTGKVHCNYNIYLNGSPVTFQKLVSAGGTIYHKERGRYSSHGYKEHAATIQLPGTELPSLQNLAAQRGLIISGGNIDLADLEGSLGSLPPNFEGIIYATGNVYVEGKTTRPITIVSENNIYITDDIEKGINPDLSPATVGLIAQNYIYINVSHGGPLLIEAALMSLTKTWKALGSGCKGPLTISGSIVTASGGSAGPYLCHTRHYIWDRDLLLYEPPFYPDVLGGNYRMINWEEQDGELDWREVTSLGFGY